MNTKNAKGKKTTTVSVKQNPVDAKMQKALKQGLASVKGKPVLTKGIDNMLPVKPEAKVAETAKAAKPSEQKSPYPKPSQNKVVMEIVKDFPDLPYTVQRLVVNGQDFGSAQVWRGDEFIADVRAGYELLPNEYVLTWTDEVAKEVGAVPWHEYEGEWFNKAEKHVIYGGRDGKDTQMHALYTWNKQFEVRKNDKISLGFSIHNSIDRSMGLGGGFFTYRHACTNMFFMGFKGRGMDFDERVTQAYFYKRHTSEIAKGYLKDLMRLLIAEGEQAIALIRALDERKLTQQKAERLWDIVGKNVLQDEAKPFSDYIKVVEGKNDKPDRYELTKPVSEYDVWNDLTDHVTHDPDMVTQTKLLKFGKIDRLLVAPIVRRMPTTTARRVA
jgi:hypothetical protein